MAAAGTDETHRLGKRVTAHFETCGVGDAVSAGLDCIDHLARCDVAWRTAAPGEDDDLIDLLVKHETPIDPTPVVWDRGPGIWTSCSAETSPSDGSIGSIRRTGATGRAAHHF